MTTYAPLYIAIALAAVLCAAQAGNAQPTTVTPPNWPDFKQPDPPANPDALGSHIQRAMTLLATSTPEKHNKVRILYYGQSITAQPWTGYVTQYLKATYPNADIQAENRAIGGFTAPSLIHTAEFDLYNYQPDLLIFHVYGGDTTGELEKIIQRVRQRTTADIIFRTPHLRWAADLPRDASPDDPKVKGADASDEQQAVKVRELAAKYGCELADTRQEWRQYLAKYDLKPKDMLADGIHLKEDGNRLMAALVIPHLRYDPSVPQDQWKNLTRDLPVGGPDVKKGDDGSFEVSFTGNRLDVIAAAGADEKPGTAAVLIDGKSPADFQELYSTNRPSQAFGMWWPAIRMPAHDQPRVLEHWSLKVTKVDVEKGNFWFDVTGSKTGPDGSGERQKRFVSNSGRIIIEPGDWWMGATKPFPPKDPLTVGFEVKWDVIPLFVDPYQAVRAQDLTRETTTMLFHGLSNAPHTVKLVPKGDGPLFVAGFRAYKPPLQ